MAEPLGQQSVVCDAFELALKRKDAAGLLAILASPQGEAVRRTLAKYSYIPARTGDVACLRVLHEHGFLLNDMTWELAAFTGRKNCLEFAISHGYKVDDGILARAVRAGELPCVELLLQQGLPQKPCLLSMRRTTPSQLECMQVMVDRKAAIDPRTLIEAARHGNVDFVRWLHQRGLPLWREARELREASPSAPVSPWGGVRYQPEPPGAIAIPSDPHALEGMWRALRYGAAFGAPVTPRAVTVFTEKRQRTHAVLRCFEAGTRLCKGPGGPRQMHVWAGMAALPSDLTKEILILADLEIPESMMHRLPLQASAIAP